MGYSLGCSPFFVMFNRMFNKWGQNAVTPIYTHIPQYPEITGYFFIPSYNRMVPLLTIGRNGHAKIFNSQKHIRLHTHRTADRNCNHRGITYFAHIFGTSIAKRLIFNSFHFVAFPFSPSFFPSFLFFRHEAPPFALYFYFCKISCPRGN